MSSFITIIIPCLWYKGGYPVYFTRSLELLRPGGVIAVDNTLYKVSYTIG